MLKRVLWVCYETELNILYSNHLLKRVLSVCYETELNMKLKTCVICMLRISYKYVLVECTFLVCYGA